MVVSLSLSGIFCQKSRFFDPRYSEVFWLMDSKKILETNTMTKMFQIFFMDLDVREHYFPATWKSRKWSKSTFYILIGLANRKSRLLILTFYLIYFDFMLCMDLLRVGRAHLRLCFGSPLRACQPSDIITKVYI